MARPRGRPRKPTALHVITGNPGKRDLPENEPQPALLTWEEPPEHLSPVAVEKWREMVPLLARNNVFSEMDVDLLAIYCEAHAIELNAIAQLEKYSEIVKSKKSGYPVPNPYVAIRNHAWKTKQDIMSEFGMSPSARTRIDTNATPRRDGKKAAKGSLLD